MSNDLWVGAVDPEAFVISISSPVLTATNGAVDLSTVSAVSVLWVRPGGLEPLVWTGLATIGTPSAIARVAAHVFEAGDVPVAGDYVALVSLQTPAGLRRCEPITKRARDWL